MFYYIFYINPIIILIHIFINLKINEKNIPMKKVKYINTKLITKYKIIKIPESLTKIQNTKYLIFKIVQIGISKNKIFRYTNMK